MKFLGSFFYYCLLYPNNPLLLTYYFELSITKYLVSAEIIHAYSLSLVKIGGRGTLTSRTDFRLSHAPRDDGGMGWFASNASLVASRNSSGIDSTSFTLTIFVDRVRYGWVSRAEPRLISNCLNMIMYNHDKFLSERTTDLSKIPHPHLRNQLTR